MSQVTIHPDRIEVPRDDHRITELVAKLHRMNPEYTRQQHEWAVWRYLTDAVDTLVADAEHHHAFETIGKAPQPWEMPFESAHTRKPVPATANGYAKNGYAKNGYTSIMPNGGAKELANELAYAGIDNGGFDVVFLANQP